MRRENMTEKDWEYKFELLLSEDLIDLPLDYFDEQLYYNDPNELNEIFTQLEEKNLYLIHQSQEVEQQLESMKQQEVYLKSKLGKEMDLHLKNKKQLEEQIENSRKNYNDLKKRN